VVVVVVVVAATDVVDEVVVVVNVGITTHFKLFATFAQTRRLLTTLTICPAVLQGPPALLTAETCEPEATLSAEMAIIARNFFI
jgi:hypothetical protein